MLSSATHAEWAARAAVLVSRPPAETTARLCLVEVIAWPTSYGSSSQVIPGAAYRVHHHPEHKNQQRCVYGRAKLILTASAALLSTPAGEFTNKKKGRAHYFLKSRIPRTSFSSFTSRKSRSVLSARSCAPVSSAPWTPVALPMRPTGKIDSTSITSQPFAYFVYIAAVSAFGETYRSGALRMPTREPDAS